MELEHNPNILAYLTVSIDESKVKDQSLSLDEQLRGDQPNKSSETAVESNVSKNKSNDKVDDNDSQAVEPEATVSDDAVEPDAAVSDDAVEPEPVNDAAGSEETTEDKEKDVEVE